MNIKITFFKDTGKYYTEDTVHIPEDLQEVWQIVDWLKENVTSHKGMYLMATLDELPNGYPILIIACQRR